MRLAALSVDLDEVPCYAAIHGLSAPDDGSAHAIYRQALPRLERFLEAQSIPATFFAIGSDLQDPQAADAVRRLHAAGHEVGNHSQNHRYDLTRQDNDAIGREIDEAADAIEGTCGQRPRGFRAPGYTITDAVFRSLRKRGYLYDSSVFPCPAYFGAKAAAISWIGLRGRRSHSVVDDPRVLSAPADPYRVGEPYWARGEGLLELPIGVTRDLSLRLPYIGTSVVSGGLGVAASLSRLVVGRPLVNLELHGIDLADAETDGLGWLRGHQPDLRRSAAHKTAALAAAIDVLRRADYRFVTLADAARILQ